MSTTNCQSHSAGVIDHALPDKVNAQDGRLGQHLSEFCQRDLKVPQRQLEFPSAAVVHNEALDKVDDQGVRLGQHLSEMRGGRRAPISTWCFSCLLQTQMEHSLD
jgi:hypothetical protein